MFLDNIFNLFLIVSAVHGFVFCGVALYSKMGKEKSMRYLVLLVLMISLSNMQTWGLKPLLQEYGNLNYVYLPWHFLIGAYFYSFLIYYLQIEKKCFSVLNWVIPFFVLTIIVRVIFYYNMQRSGVENLFWLFKKYASLEEGVSLLFSLGAFLYAYFVFLNKKESYEKLTSFDNLKWIHWFFKIAALNYLVWFAALFATIFINNYEFKYSYFPLKVFSAILIYWLGYQGFIQFRLLKERQEIRNAEKKQKSEKSQSVLIIGQNEEKRGQFEKIEKYLILNNKFTNPNITMENLANDLGISSSIFSQLVNQYAQKSFPDYINYFRVELAKKMLLNPAYKEYTIVAIGLESGFNSKSTFYSAFKKYEKCTPTQFKKQHS